MSRSCFGAATLITVLYMSGFSPVGAVHRARDLAEQLLVELPERWRHTIGVARRAETVTGTLGSHGDRAALLAAAWLHDIGYAPELRDTGFHPIDGARYLQAHHWPARIAGLVAHHSGALCVARVRGLAEAMACFPHEDSAVCDALIYADQTVGPNGRDMNVEHRLADMLRRHGPGSPNAAAHMHRAPLLRAAVHRVEQRLGATRQRSSAA
jgi:putative nucleotidyltransferase with HDIG domain